MRLPLVLVLVLVAGAPAAAQERPEPDEEDQEEMFIPPMDPREGDRLVLRRGGPREPDQNRIQIPEARGLEVICKQAEAAATAADWPKAARLYLDVLRSQRDPEEGIQRVAKIGAGRYYSYVRMIRERLLSFPEEGRAAFRALAESEAKQLFEDSAARADPRGLETVWRIYPISTVADEALERLGDMALESGDPALALPRYERAQALPGGDLDPQRLAAKIARVQKMLAAAAPPRTGVTTFGPPRWAVVGGDNAHAASLPGIAGIATAPRFFVPLPTSRGSQMWGLRAARRQRLDGQTLPADLIVETLPVADQRKIVFTTANAAWCFDLTTGERVWVKGQLWNGADPGPNIFYSATIAGGRVFAPFIKSVSSAEYYRGIPIKEAIATRRLVALELATGKVIWDHAETEDPFLRWVSVGLPPICRDGVLYATAVLGQVGREGSSKCYLIAVDAATGRLLWRRFIGGGQVELTMFGEPAIESLFMQPAEEGGTIHVVSALGHAAAVSALTGEIEWLATYETIPIEPARTYYAILRELPWRNGPPILYQGAFIVTPMDSPKAYAFDARTGEVRWAIDHGSLRRLIGVHDGRVVFQGERLHSYDVRTGKLALAFPRSLDQAGFGEEDTGRGLICGGVALIPLPTRIARVDLSTGDRVPDMPIPGGIKDSGTLLYLGKDLIAVNPQRASVFPAYPARDGGSQTVPPAGSSKKASEAR